MICSACEAGSHVDCFIEWNTGIGRLNRCSCWDADTERHFALMDERDRALEPGPPLTVGELRAALAGVPDEFIVEAEGCDCIGDADGVVIQDGKVLIARNKAEYLHEPWKPSA